MLTGISGYSSVSQVSAVAQPAHSAPAAQTNRLPQDTVTLSPAAQQASTAQVDRDHDGDSQ
jgi:hypothetical protein